MTMSLESIEAEALKLTPDERSALASRLLISLADNDTDRAWAVEIARRDAEADADPSRLIDADEAIAQARRAIA